MIYFIWGSEYWISQIKRVMLNMNTELLSLNINKCFPYALFFHNDKAY